MQKICGMRPVGRNDQSIDLKMFLQDIPFAWFLWLLLWLLLNDAYFSQSLLWFTIKGVYFYFSNETVIQSFGVCLQINYVVTKDPRTHCFLNWDSWFFTRWVPGLTITIYNKITASEITFLTNTIQGGLTLLTLLWSLKWRKHFNSSYPASLTETRDPELPDPFLLPISHELP